MRLAGAVEAVEAVGAVGAAGAVALPPMKQQERRGQHYAIIEISLYS